MSMGASNSALGYAPAGSVRRASSSNIILQAGDLGAFFDRARLDRATIRHAQHDPS